MTLMRAFFDHDLDRYRITGDLIDGPTVRVDLELSVTAWFTLTGELAEIAIHTIDEPPTGELDADHFDADTHRIVDTLCGPSALELLLDRHRSVPAQLSGVVDLGELDISDDALEQQRNIAATAWANNQPGSNIQPVGEAQHELAQVAGAVQSRAITVWSEDELATTVDAVAQGTGTVAERPAGSSTGRLVRLGAVHVHLTDTIPDGLDLSEPAQITWQPVSGELDIQLTRLETHSRIPDGWWIRVSTYAGLTLAIAPLGPAGRAHSLLVIDDDTLDDTIVDLTVEPTRSVGGSNDRVRSRLARLAAIAHDAEHDDDAATAAHAWQAAAHIADDHGHADLADHLRTRARQHRDATPPRPPRTSDVEPESGGDAAAPARRQNVQRIVTIIIAAAVAAVVAAAAVWALTRSAADTSDGATVRTPTADSPAVAQTPDASVPVDAGTNQSPVPQPVTSQPATTSPTTTQPATTVPIAGRGVSTVEYLAGDPTPFTGILERIELTVQTLRLAADEPLDVLVEYVRTTPGDPWAPGQPLSNCLGNVGRALPVDVESPFAPRAQLTASYRAAPIENGVDNLEQYREPDGGWVPLVVTTPVTELITVATSSTVTGCRLADPQTGLGEQVQVAYQQPYQPTVVSIDVATLDPGTYTLVPVVVNGIPTSVEPGLATFTVTDE